MVAPTAQAQLMLELINRARLDPAAEAVRQGIALNSGIAANSISTAPKQALAFNFDLNDTAQKHSDDMNAHNYFAHNSLNGTDPGQRMTAEGFGFSGNWTWGENIAAAAPATNTPAGLAAAITGNHDQLYASTHGHRQQIFDGGIREIGIGQSFGYVSAGFNTGSIVTQDFATTSARANFLTGVVINDLDNDRFYDVGEGRGGVSIAVSGMPSAATWAAGGYGIANVTAGAHTVTFSGGGLAAAVSATVAMPAHSVKFDLIGARTIESSASTTLGANATGLILLGDAAAGTGNALNNTLVGSQTANVLTGGAGFDVMTGKGGPDRFDFNSVTEIGNASSARDSITDFVAGTDKIDLKSIDAITGAGLANDTFNYHTGAFTGVGQVHVVHSGAITLIEGNTSGSAAADFQIELKGNIAIGAADIIL